MSVTIHEVLGELRASALDERDKGDKFERLVQSFLRTDPEWTAKFDDVWTWTRATDQDGKAVLRPSEAGTWLIRVVIERPGPEAEREQFDHDSWTATLVINIRAKP